jgi:acyl carrier protein
MPLVAAVAMLCFVACDRQSEPKAAVPALGDHHRTRQKVLAIVAELLEKDPATIDPQQQLGHPDIGADELDVVEIIMEVEDAFGIEIPDEAFIDPQTKALTEITVQKLVGIVLSSANRRNR